MMRERWLFFMVLALFLGGLAAAIWVADSGRTPGYALDSNLIYRIEIGAVLVGFAYAILVTLRLAWRGEMFTKFSVGPAGAEAGDSFESAADDLDILRDRGAATLRRWSRRRCVALAERLERLEAGHRG